MSFFFHKSKPRHKGPQKATGKGFETPSRGTKANAGALHRLGCAACPLDKCDALTPKMAPTLASETLIYFLAEAPGRDEDENTGEPLTGPSGSLLRECIPDGQEEYCSFDNVINCRPPKNRTPIWQEVECCRPRRIKTIERAKPRLIVGLGAVPMHALLGTLDMAGMRGRLFAIKVGSHNCWYLPTYHPSFILRTAFDKRKPLQSKLGHCFRMDIQKAFDIVSDLEPIHIDTEQEIRSNVQTFNGSGGETIF